MPALAVVVLIFIIVAIFQTETLCTVCPAPEMGPHLGCEVAKTGQSLQPFPVASHLLELISAQHIHSDSCTFMLMSAATPLSR